MTWFWDVRREQTDLTAAARNGTPGDVAFGSAGQSVYIGYTDPFHLAPAVSGAALHVSGLALTYRAMHPRRGGKSDE